MIQAYIPENLVSPGIHPVQKLNGEIVRKPGQESWVCVIQRDTLVDYELAVAELLEILTDAHGEEVARTAIIQVNT